MRKPGRTRIRTSNEAEDMDPIILVFAESWRATAKLHFHRATYTYKVGEFSTTIK